MFVEKLAFGADFSTILHLGEDMAKSELTTNEPSSQSGCIFIIAYVHKIRDQANRSLKFSKLNTFEECELALSNVET